MAAGKGGPLRGYDTFVRRVLRDWKVNGAAVAVVKEDEAVLCMGYGLRDAEQQQPVTEHTLFPLASVTKAFTTASMAVLVDDGVLAWDSPVRTYLPSFQLWDRFASERITPRDLVTHRSGLPRHDQAWYRSDDSREEIVRRLRYLQPSADFRTLWQYQNLMYMTAGYLVGELTGSTWEDVVQRRILDPLGMVSTAFSVRATEHASDRSFPYARLKGKVQQIPFYEDQDAIGPAGCLVSNVADMSRWLLLHLNGGSVDGRQLISSAQVSALHAPQMVMEGGKWQEMPQCSYALGWFVEPYRGHMMLHHSGNIDGFSTLCAFLPRERVGVVALTNMSGSPVPYILAWNAFDRFLELGDVPWNDRYKADMKEIETASTQGKARQNMDRVKGTRPSHPLDAYAGTFAHPGYGKLEVRREEKGLTAHYHTMDFALTHYHYDTFLVRIERLDTTMKVQFLTNVRGEIDRLVAPMEPTVEDIVFTRIPEESLKDPARLRQFAGTYEVMGLPVSVTLRGDVLVIRAPGQPEFELVPVKGSEFALKGPSGFTVEFRLDESDAVVEALLNQRGMLFTAPRKKEEHA